MLPPAEVSISKTHCRAGGSDLNLLIVTGEVGEEKTLG